MVFRFVSPLKKENAPIHCKDHGGGSQAMASSNWLLAKEELQILRLGRYSDNKKIYCEGFFDFLAYALSQLAAKH